MVLESIGYWGIWFIDADGDMNFVDRYLPVGGKDRFESWFNSPLWDQVGQLLLNA